MPAPRRPGQGAVVPPRMAPLFDSFCAAPSGVSAALAIEKTPPRSERSGVALRLRARGTRAMRVGAPGGGVDV